MATHHPIPRACVLTGDIIGSTALPAEARDRLHAVLRAAADEVRGELPNASPLDLAIYRGDGWQLLLLDHAAAFRAALLFRAYLRSELEPESRSPVDTRVAIGVGKLDALPATVGEGSGEAFQLSGRALESIGARRLVYAAPVGSGLNDWDVACRLMDAIITGWTARQARAVRGALLGRTQKDIGALWTPPISQPAVADHLRAAKWDALDFTLKAYERRCSKQRLDPQHRSDRS